MSEQPILSRREGAVEIITLNRPDRLNALSLDLVAALHDAVDDAVDGGARAIILTGSGRGFCSGADLQGGGVAGGLKQRKPDMGGGLEASINPLLEKIADLPIPVITAINGPAAGAGVGFAIAGDFAIAARSSYLLLAFVNVGLVPDAGLTYYLPRLVGRQRAIELMMLGERLPAETALEWGILHKVVDDDQVLGEALKLANKLAAAPSNTLALIKRNVRKSLESGLTETLRYERTAQRECGAHDNFAEGVAAFLEKRKAVFK